MDPAAAPPVRRAAFVVVALAAASWGAWSLFVRPTHLPGTVTTPIVFLVMGLVSLPFAQRGPRVVWNREIVGLAIANGLFDGINLAAYFTALQYTTVAIAVLTHYLAPILVALAAPRVDGVVSRGARPAAAVALLGLVIILEPWHAPADGAVLGALLGMMSAVFYAGNVFATRRLAARVGAVRALAYHAVVAGVVLMPFAVPRLGQVTLGDVGLLAVGATTIGAVSGVVFTLGLMRIGSARAAVLTFVEPVVAVVIGAVAWGEALHPVAIIGGALVLGAGIEVARKAR